jgi:hypothetical protein
MASKLQQAAKTPKSLMQAAATPKNPESRRPTLDVNALVEQGVFNSAEPAPAQEKPNLLRIFSQAQDDAMTFGLTKPGGPLDKVLAPLFGKEPIQPYQPQTTAEEVAQTAGDITGSMAPISGLYSTLGRAAAGLIPKAASGVAAKVGRAVLPGAVSGAVYEGTKAAVEGKDAGEVAKEAAIGGALFGGGDVALRAAGKGLKKLYEMARKPKAEVNVPTPETIPVQTQTVEPRITKSFQTNQPEYTLNNARSFERGKGFSSEPDYGYNSKYLNQKARSGGQVETVAPAKNIYVSDKDGNPIVLYHGTTNNFDKFDVLQQGKKTLASSAKEATFFTDSESTAQFYMHENPKTLKGKVSEKYEKAAIEKAIDIRDQYRKSGMRDGYGVIYERDKSSGAETINLDKLAEFAQKYDPTTYGALRSKNMTTGKTADAGKVIDVITESYGGSKLIDLSKAMENYIKEYATQYGNKYASEVIGKTPHIKKANLEIKNPLIVDFNGRMPQLKEIANIVSRAKKEGHDGGLIKNISDGGRISNHYFVFNPEKQIKIIGGSDQPPKPQYPLPPKPREPEPKASIFPKPFEAKGKGLASQPTKSGISETEPPLPEGISPMSLKPPSTIETITSKTEKESILQRIAPARVAQKLKSVYYKTIDGYNRLNEFDKLAVRSGQKLADNEKSYILAHNSSNAEAIAQRNLTEFMTDIDGNIVGDPLLKIVRQVPKNKWREFEDYLKLNHFKAWEREGMEVYDKSLNMNEILADKKIADYETKNPWIKQAAADYTNWIKQFGENWLVKTGNISQEAWNAMRTKYQGYIPMQRLLDEVEEAGLTGGAKRSFADQPSQVKTAKGSERKTIESLETLLEQVPRMIKSAKRNQVMQQIIAQLQKNPDDLAGFAELVDPKTTNLTFANIVSGRVNGERVYLRVNDLPLLEAITNLSPKGQNMVIEGARFITSRMKLLTTGINPLFSLGRNIVRDLPMSYVASKSTDNPAVWARDLVGAVIDIFGNRDVYKAYKAIGGGQASAAAADRNLLAESKAKLLPGYFNLSNIKNPVEYAKRLLGVPFNILEKLADVTETAPRLGEFRRILRQEGNTAATRQKALYESKDVTVNFWKTKTAEVSSFLDAFVPYFGAAIQGMDKLARIYVDRPVAALVKSFGAITVPTLILYAMNHNNPNYQRLSSWVKDTNFLIPLPDDTFLKLPKPRESGMVFGALVERSLAEFKDKDPYAFDKFMDTIKANFVPPSPFTDNILSPLITDIPSNKDFAGRPIVPEYQKRLSPGLQYDEKTSSFAKKVGEKFPEAISPKQLDYAVKSYLGVIGQVGIPALSEGSTKEMLKRMFTADPLYSQDVVSRFYDKKKELDTLSANAKSKDGQLLGDEEKLRKLYTKMADTISETSQELREIQQDKTMSEEAKKRESRGLQAAIVSVAELASKPLGEQIKAYDDLKRKGKIIEKRPLTPARKETQERKDEKDRQGMVKFFTK